MKSLNEKELLSVNGGEKALGGFPYSTLICTLIKYEYNHFLKPYLYGNNKTVKG